LGALQDECYDIIGPTTVKQLHAEAGKKPIKWHATANYGECDNLKAFCVENNLGYIHHSDSTFESNASLVYWMPGMKHEYYMESNQEHSMVVEVNTIKPYTDLLLEYAKRGADALPLFIGSEILAETIEKCLKKPKKALEIIGKRINNLLPGDPILLPFIIKE
jgi:hypothetical protein